MKSIILRSALAIFTLFTVNAVVAQNMHYVKGPTASLSGNSLVFSGKLAGLGSNENVTFTFSGSAVCDIECSNGGNNVVEVKDQTIPGVSGSGSGSSGRNGTFNLTLNVPITLSSNPCPRSDNPNKNWSPSITSVNSFTGTLTITDSHGNSISVSF